MVIPYLSLTDTAAGTEFYSTRPRILSTILSVLGELLQLHIPPHPPSWPINQLGCSTFHLRSPGSPIKSRQHRDRHMDLALTSDLEPASPTVSASPDANVIQFLLPPTTTQPPPVNLRTRTLSLPIHRVE